MKSNTEGWMNAISCAVPCSVYVPDFAPKSYNYRSSLSDSAMILYLREGIHSLWVTTGHWNDCSGCCWESDPPGLQACGRELGFAVFRGFICPRAPAHREWKVPGNAVPLGPQNQPQAVRIQSPSSWHEVEWLWGISYVQNFSPSWGLLLGRSQPRTQSMILK